ncbi:7504_t:CDS:2 [Cetraspora pellucida]|uniref:7504_t:CDS:1 n=1 Tax=Cetraspora pellucida TaxID=1433469 RepID=A0A9N9EDU3_9GLOM|nr:7504_t:CDS:2 [Cetraspora pellucida]
MNSMNLLASDGTIVGMAVLHEKSNQFHSTSIPLSYCVLSLSKYISPYPLEIPDPFENYTELSQLNQELSLSINNNKEFSDDNLAEPSIIVGHTFAEWCDVEQYINAYTITQGFATRLVTVHWAKNENKYHIKLANLEHNHSMDSAVVIFDPGYQKLSNNKKAQIQVLHNSDARNRIKGLSQVAKLLNNLQNKDKYKITYSVKNNRLYSLFFTTSDSLMTFEHYSEVILMDSTYKTNRFGMPLLLISGIDAMGITFLIASRLISDETNINYGIRTIQRSEASNAHLKRLLNTIAPLPELISKLDKLSCQQLQYSQYQQYCICGSTYQNCPELLKNISSIVSNFTYSLILEQYNLAKIKAYSIEKQDRTFKVYYSNNYKHAVDQTDITLVCSCNYTTQFSLPCHHIIAIHIAIQKAISVNYIGKCWRVDLHNSTQFRQQITNNDFSATTFGLVSDTDFIPSANSTSTINFTQTTNSVETAESVSIASTIVFADSNNQEMSTKNTVELLKEIESICNYVGHIQINDDLTLFVNQLKNKYSLCQDDIEDPMLIKTKGRPSSTKCKRTGTEQAIKKIYICSICSGAGHNSRSCPKK